MKRKRRDLKTANDSPIAVELKLDMLQAYADAAKHFKAESDRAQAVLNGVASEHAIVEAAKAQAAAIVAPARARYLAALEAMSQAVAPIGTPPT